MYNVNCCIHPLVYAHYVRAHIESTNIETKNEIRKLYVLFFSIIIRYFCSITSKHFIAMKNSSPTVALLATLLLTSSCQTQPQNDTTTSTRQGYYGDDNNPTPTLVGDIESVTVKSLYASGTLESQTTYGVDTWNEYEFNERGDVTTRRICADDGTPFDTTLRTYTPEGALLTEKVVTPEGYMFESTTLTYDSEGRLTERVFTEWSESLTTRYEYEGERLTLSETYETGNHAKIVETTRYLYDSEGRLTQESTDSPAEQYRTRHAYTYGEGATTTDYFTATLGEEFPSHYSTRTICTYTPEGLLLSEKILGVDGSNQGEVSFTYDTNGNTTSKIGTGVERAYHHTYDPQGNVTRTIVTSLGEVKSIIEYTIHYRK